MKTKKYLILLNICNISLLSCALMGGNLPYRLQSQSKNTKNLNNLKNISNVQTDDGLIITFESQPTRQESRVNTNENYKTNYCRSVEARTGLGMIASKTINLSAMIDWVPLKSLCESGQIIAFEAYSHSDVRLLNVDGTIINQNHCDIVIANINDTVNEHPPVVNGSVGKNANYHLDVHGILDFRACKIKYIPATNKFEIDRSDYAYAYADARGDGGGWSCGDWGFHDEKSLGTISYNAGMNAVCNWNKPWFDCGNILSFKDSKRYIDVKTQYDTLHTICNVNQNYFEASLGNITVTEWTNDNNWIANFAMPQEVKEWLNTRADVVDIINQGMKNGRLWDQSLSQVNRYAIPISGQILFNNVCYINTGTYENPNSANPNSLGLVLKYAFENKNNTNLTELLNAKINSATLLSWKKSLEAGMYNYDFTNFGQKTVANYKKAINAVMNALNKRWSLNGEYWYSNNKDGSGASKFRDLNAGGSFLEILNGSVNIPTIQEGAQDQPNQYIDIRNVELSFGKFDRLTLNGDWVVDEIREIDAINPRQTVLTQGKSVLKDTGASTVAWTDENWKEFLECLKFKDTADLVGELTKGQIDLDDESMADSPLYGYTVTNITSSMFCNIKNNYENIFGSDVDLLVKNIAFEVEPTDDDIINVTITTKEEDSISFHSSGWFSLIENYQPNTNTTTVPDVSTMDVNDFLAQVGNDGITLVSSFTKWIGSTTNKYWWNSNLTEMEFEEDIKDIENPVILMPDEANGSLRIDIRHHQYFNIDHGIGDVITESYTLDGFKAVPPAPPIPPTPINPANPASWILWGSIGIGAAVLAGGSIATILAVRRKRRKIQH